MTETLIEARDIIFCWPASLQGLAGASIELKAGQRTALLGATGSGKSTLLLHLNGLLQPSGGLVRHRGVPINYDDASLRTLRSAVGLVFQNPDDQLFGGSVLQDAAFGPLNMGLNQTDARERAREALASLHIGDLETRSIGQLSFGQRKLVAIAGVLAMRPNVLMLDEPTAGLDHQATRKLMSLLETFSSANHAILISTHDIFLAESWANSVCVLERGTTVFSGMPETLLGDRDLLKRAGLPTGRMGLA